MVGEDDRFQDHPIVQLLPALSQHHSGPTRKREMIYSNHAGCREHSV
jgi:hypothetical protein